MNTSAGVKRKAGPPLLGGRPMIKETRKMKHGDRNFVLRREKGELGFRGSLKLKTLIVLPRRKKRNREQTQVTGTMLVMYI